MTARLALLAAAALTFAGCGGGSSDKETSAPAPAKTKAPSASAGAPSKTASETISDFTFAPKSVTVAAGGSVSWKNKDAANHNVVFDDKSIEGIENLRENQDGKVEFDKAGTYAYVCSYHPGMEGTVVVK